MSGSRCQNCGTMVPSGAAKCPSCGEPFEGFGASPADTVYYGRQGFGKRPDNLGPMPKLILAYGILALIFGLMLMVSLINLDGTWNRVSGDDGKYYGLTKDEFRTMVQLLGAIFIASGACAAVSGFLSGRRVMFMASFVLCTLSALLALAMCIADRGLFVLGFLLFLIGAFMANRIRVNKDSFSS